MHHDVEVPVFGQVIEIPIMSGMMTVAMSCMAGTATIATSFVSATFAFNP
jgi:hypothetical protein